MHRNALYQLNKLLVYLIKIWKWSEEFDRSHQEQESLANARWACEPWVYEDLFFPSHRCLTPPSCGTPCDINAFYTSLKSTFSGLQYCCRRYGSMFIRLAVVASRNRKITRNADKIWPYSTSRPYKVIDLGVNRKLICDFLLVINSTVTLTVSATVFEILTLKARKWLIFPTPALFGTPTRGTHQNF